MARQSKVDDEQRDEPDDVLKIVGERLKEARKKSSLTQGQLARKAGVGQPYIFELEQGSSNITIKTLVKMAGVLEIDPRDLLPDLGSSLPTQSGVERLAAAFDQLAHAIRERSAQDAELLREFQSAAGLREAMERFLKAGVSGDRTPAGDPADGSRSRSAKKPR